MRLMFQRVTGIGEEHAVSETLRIDLAGSKVRVLRLNRVGRNEVEGGKPAWIEELKEQRRPVGGGVSERENGSMAIGAAGDHSTERAQRFLAGLNSGRLTMRALGRFQGRVGEECGARGLLGSVLVKSARRELRRVVRFV